MGRQHSAEAVLDRPVVQVLRVCRCVQLEELRLVAVVGSCAAVVVVVVDGSVLSTAEDGVAVVALHNVVPG